MAEAAKQGDLTEFVTALNDDILHPPVAKSWGDVGDMLNQCLDTLAKRGPEHLATAMLTQMLLKYSQMYTRCSITVDSLISQHEARGSGPGCGLGMLPPDVANTWLPRMSKIDGEIQKLTRTLLAIRNGEPKAPRDTAGSHPKPDKP